MDDIPRLGECTRTLHRISASEVVGALRVALRTFAEPHQIQEATAALLSGRCLVSRTKEPIVVHDPVAKCA